MLEKVKNVISRCSRSNRLSAVLCIVFFLISFMYFVVDIGYTELFYYPEEEYQLLEDEARVIMKENDFKTEYELEIKSYNNKTDYMSFSLKNENAIVYTNVENYLEDNQIVTIQREYESQKEKIIDNVFNILILSFAFACIGYLIFLLVLGIMYVILKILVFILKVISKIKKK